MSQTVTINGQAVSVRVVNPDGSDGGSSLDARETWLVAAIDAFLRANARFAAAYLGAKLVLVESNRELDESKRGRFYLRYAHAQGAAEFWGNLAARPSFNFKRGTVGVVAPGDAPGA